MRFFFNALIELMIVCFAIADRLNK